MLITNRLIVITGPTSSGKSDLAIKLAKKFNGEIVSADSRQVYRSLDIGTGKTLNTRNIKHHLIDVVNPEQEFSLGIYKELATKAIDDILKLDKVPFLVGGTALYIRAIVDNYLIPAVKPDKKLRSELEKKSSEELLKVLSRLDPESVKKIDSRNKRRLIRAIEVSKKLGIPFSKATKKQKSPWKILQLAISLSREELYKKIDKRVDDRIKQGMTEEVKNLIRHGVSKDWLKSLGLEYRYIIYYLECKVGSPDPTETIQKLKYEIHRFARSQLVWFRKDKRIRWIKNYQEAEIAIKKFLWF